ncbi:MAG: FAD-dependent oxidoreductase [Candidatus Heimdallarchaeota archaeon]
MTSTTENGNHSIVVIGGGIAGISASLDLAEQGHHVYLVERSPSIGGRMAQLDKTFPTLDCSICILAPKMVETLRHPNITLLTYSEVEDVQQREDGTFKVKVRRKARYVKEEICTGCALCTTVCPRRAPNEFEMGLANRTAIYIPFPQAVPAVATIDPKICRRLTGRKCNACTRVCERGALDFDQKDRFIDLDVTSIIIATGFELLDPEAMLAYGYGRLEDVVTSLEYERMMSASGPSSGEILRPSDSKHPKTIAFILCVGSRNIKKKSYCSKICCMYATKEAMITREHAPNTEVIVYYNDKRAIGKGHEEFFNRAATEFGITYKIGLPSEVLREPETDRLLIEHANLEKGSLDKDLVDLVVLLPAIVPSAGTDKLAEILGVEVDEAGFIWTDPNNPVQTSVPNIFACGCITGPEDISTSVIQGSAAAAAAANVQPPKEIVPVEISGETRSIVPSQYTEPRIGVYVCACGINIGGTIDVPLVADYAKTLKNVVYATDMTYVCSQDAQDAIKKAIKTYQLNCLVVASCTPRTHLKLFQETANEAGLNPYLVDMASLRELDSWVHMTEPQKATEKAKDLVRMSVARARLLSPKTTTITRILPVACVIGAGVAGMTAALTIAEKGYSTYLIEREADIGGFVRELHFIDFLETRGETVLKALSDKVWNHPHITVLTSTEVQTVNGAIGNFEIGVTGHDKIQAGVIIIATGAEHFKPEGYYHYGESPKIQTQLDFAQAIRDGTVGENEIITMILCTGARETNGREYCSLVCCSEAIKDALFAKKKFPNTQVNVLFRDIRVHYEGEDYFRKARGLGVRFLNYTPEAPPQVEISPNNGITVRVHETVTRTDLKLPSDRLVLVTPIVANKDNHRLSEMLKVPLETNEFFLEAHVKLRPVDFATEGIFVCGTANGPKNVRDSLAQAAAAASRALTFLMKGISEAEPLTAEVNRLLCIGCSNCVFACSYNAIYMEDDNIAAVNPALCKGCGVCAVTCPAEAITMHHFTNEQIMAMVETVLEDPGLPEEPKIVGLLCNWCCYAGADNAGVSRFQYPPAIRPIRVMCSGRVDPLIILRAFQLGADGFFVGGCHPGDCHYIAGNYHAQKELTDLKNVLAEIGINPERLRLEWVSASEGKRFADVITEFTEQIRAMEPIEFRKKRLTITAQQISGEQALLTTEESPNQLGGPTKDQPETSEGSNGPDEDEFPITEE